MATRQRKVEIFSAGCSVCTSVIDCVKELACESCDVQVLDMHTSAGEKRAGELGVRSVPAVAIDGRLAECCSSRGVDESVLRAAGLGQPLG